jgi:molybdenum-dependent DNA-binding transcriptional regulator ModE
MSDSTIRLTLVEHVELTEREVELLKALNEEGSVEVYEKRVEGSFMPVEVIKLLENEIDREETKSLVEKKLIEEKTDYNLGYTYLIVSYKGHKVLQELRKKEQESMQEDDE